MTKEEIERQSEAAVALFREKVGPAAAAVLGEEWFVGFKEAWADLMRYTFAQAYEEAARAVTYQVEMATEAHASHEQIEGLLLAQRVVRSLKAHLEGPGTEV